jgi:hypothetical protein
MNSRIDRAATSAGIGPRRKEQITPPTPVASTSRNRAATVSGEPANSARSGFTRAGGTVSFFMTMPCSA